MTRSVAIPRYTNNDFPILIATMLPMSVLLNYFLYGNRYFNKAGLFFWTTLVSFLVLGTAFIVYGAVALYLRNRFPDDDQSFKRLSICLSLFFLMSLVYISLVLRGFDFFNFYGYRFDENDFLKAYV